ncbi:MAG: ABC transporter substrate-binding protein, partial [Actinomycetales bacterium]
MPKQVDDKTWEVTLRDGAKFTDGNPVTTDDVVFSFERVLDPANKSLYASFIPFVEKVEKKDDKVVTIKTKYPFSLVPERLSVVKVVPKAAVEADPKAFDMMPIGTGAYKMTDNGASSQKVVLERNDDYNGPRPAKVKTVEVDIIPDDSTRTNALTSGAVMAIDSVPATNLASLSESKDVAAKQGFGLVFVLFNNGPNSPMKEQKNRQAIMYALDYAKICSVGMSDLATPASCFVQEDHPAYKKASTVYSYDLEKAKALLAETGLKEIKFLATNHGFFSGVRPIVKENLEALGIKVSYDEKKSADAYAAIGDNPDVMDVFLAPGDPSVFGDDADLLLRWWYAGEAWVKDRMQWKGSDSYNKVQKLLDTASA